MATVAHGKRRRHAALSRNTQLYEEFRAEGCVMCGEIRHAALCAHHYFGKLHGVGLMIRWASQSHFASELAKCVCLCQNCHALHHANLLPIGPDKYLGFLATFLDRLISNGHTSLTLDLSTSRRDSRFANSSKIKISPGCP